MIKVIKLIDNQCDRYLIDADCQTLGRQWDNEAEFVVVEKPAVEVEKSSTCEMFVKANGQLVDVIQVYDKPIPITSLLTQYRKITIGFSFYNSDGYVKNSEPKDFYFLEAIKPEAFTPTEPQGKERLNYLLANGITDLRWKEGGNNVLELVNADSEVVREFELSPFVQEQADLGETNPQSEKYVHNKSTKYLENEGADGSSPYASEKFVEDNLPDLDNYVTFDDYGTSSKAGVHKTNDFYGISQTSGVLKIVPALEREIDSGNSQYKPITPSVSDYAVKKGLTNPRSFYAWTEEEQALARKTLGINGTGGGDVDLSEVEQRIEEVAESIPTKTSQLENDGDGTSPFVTLLNTYTKEEVNALISAINSMKKEIVEQLPTENIDDSTIYLVPKTSGSGNDYYDEYLYINGNFEFIGNTQVDLDNYVTFDDKAEPSGDYGLIKLGASASGIGVDKNGSAYCTPARDDEIEEENENSYRNLQPKHISKIVKKGMTNNLEEWTEEDKQSARDLLGIVEAETPDLSNYATLEQLDTKLDMATDQVWNARVYGIASGDVGKTTMFDVSSSAGRNTIVRRNSNGTMTTSTPVNDNDCTTKKYVDDIKTELESTIGDINTALESILGV